MVGFKHPNSRLEFFRFGLTSLHTVDFGRFPRPKKCHFGFLVLFLKSDHLIKMFSPNYLKCSSLFIFKASAIRYLQ